MKKIFIVILLVAIYTISGSTANAADKIVFNFAYEGTEESPYGIYAKIFKRTVEEYSKGMIEVKIRCCGQLISEDQAFKALQLGSLDSGIMAQNNISPHFPLMEAFVLPYIFQSLEHSVKVLDGDIGKEIAEKMRNKTGVELLSYGYVDFRAFYNSKRPVKSIEDMKGLKVRVPKNKVMIETHNQFGSHPIPLAWSETLAALQTKTVDGADNAWAFIKGQKFYEMCKFGTDLKHFCVLLPALMGKRLTEKLNPEQLDLVRRAAKDAGVEMQDLMNREEIKTLEFLRTKGGMTIEDVDKTPFIAAGIRAQDVILRETNDKELTDMVLRIRQLAQK